eukprot:scaffold1840_cov120-Isochrysis_galbana.AAC.5
MATTWSGELFSKSTSVSEESESRLIPRPMATWGGTLAKPDLLHKPCRCCGPMPALNVCRGGWKIGKWLGARPPHVSPTADFSDGGRPAASGSAASGGVASASGRAAAPSGQAALGRVAVGAANGVEANEGWQKGAAGGKGEAMLVCQSIVECPVAFAR